MTATHPAKRLVLFDIDGTLLHGGPLWRECFEQALSTRLGPPTWPTISYSGKTDGQIASELIVASAIAVADLRTAVEDVLQEYARLARERLPARRQEVQSLPGASSIVDHLAAKPGVKVGLLTGNLRETAFLKLSAIGLHDRFDFGVFADDHWDRYEMPRIAVRKARDHLGHDYSGKEIVIIGDTIHDVKCGKSIGARALAVGTGYQICPHELRRAEPDFFLENLGNAEEVERAVFAELSA